MGAGVGVAPGVIRVAGAVAPDAIWGGLRLRFSDGGGRGSSYWSFVRPEHVRADPSISGPREHTAFSGGRHGCDTTVYRGVYHSGIDRRWVEQRAGRPPHVTHERAHAASWTRGRVVRVPVFRPRVTAVPGRAQPIGGAMHRVSVDNLNDAPAWT